MKKVELVIAVLAVFGLVACDDFSSIIPNNAKQSIADKLVGKTIISYESKIDQSYGKDPFQKYDLYIPKGDISLPEMKSVSLVMVHGGGWSILDKSFLNSVVDEFKKKGLNLTIFNINHRLAGTNNVTFSDIMDDFSLFFDHHDSLKTSLNLSNNVLLFGYSSGGHLALSYTYQFAKRKIDAVAALVAPTDLTDHSIREGIFDDKNRNLTELLIGKTFEENPLAYKQASPYFMVNGRSSNTILFYAGNDILVKKEQGEKLSEILKNKKVKTEYHLIPNVGHGLENKMGEITDRVMMFIMNVK